MEDIEEATSNIIENMGHIKIWVGQQAIMKMLSENIVSFNINIFYYNISLLS